MDKATRLKLLAKIIMDCRACALYQNRPKMVFGDGNPDAPVMLVGEAPGREERAVGTPFVGRCGRLLRDMLTAIGLDPVEDCYIANVVKDWPTNNRKPSPDEIGPCVKFLYKQVEIIRPKLLVLMGRTAVEGILPAQAKVPLDVLRDKTKTLGMLAYGDIPVLVTYHPSALLRDPSRKRGAADDFRFLQSRITYLYPERNDGSAACHVPSEQLSFPSGIGVPG